MSKAKKTQKIKELSIGSLSEGEYFRHNGKKYKKIRRRGLLPWTKKNVVRVSERGNELEEDFIDDLIMVGCLLYISGVFEDYYLPEINDITYSFPLDENYSESVELDSANRWSPETAVVEPQPVAVAEETKTHTPEPVHAIESSYDSGSSDSGSCGCDSGGGCD